MSNLIPVPLKCRDIPISVFAFGHIAERLDAYNSPRSINKKRRPRGYDQILIKLREKFDELSTRPYSQ
jgi:hypothetical protein